MDVNGGTLFGVGLDYWAPLLTHRLSEVGS